MKDNKKQAIGYVRVSTQKQVSDGLSIDAQIARIEAWAAFNEYELVHVFIDEGISGKNVNNRPELAKALSLLKKDMAFVFYSLSRVSRNVIDTISIGEQIRKASADMVSLSERIDTTGAAGRMIFNLLAVLNEFERDQVSERTKMVMSYLKENKKVYSHVPYGYDRIDKDLVINPDEAKTIEYMLKLREKGYGFRKIATQLNKENIKSKHGGLWYAKTVEHIIERNLETA